MTSSSDDLSSTFSTSPSLDISSSSSPHFVSFCHFASHKNRSVNIYSSPTRFRAFFLYRAILSLHFPSLLASPPSLPLHAPRPPPTYLTTSKTKKKRKLIPIPTPKYCTLNDKQRNGQTNRTRCTSKFRGIKGIKGAGSRSNDLVAGKGREGKGILKAKGVLSWRMSTGAKVSSIQWRESENENENGKWKMKWG